MLATPLGPLYDRLRAAALPLAGVSVVEALFWVLDPTSIELHFQTHDGPERTTKAFAIGVFTALVVASIWVGESALDAAFDGRLREGLQRMQTDRAIDRVADHVVICGHGMFGRTVADRLRDEDRTVVVIENDPDERERMSDDALVVAGDARREEILRDAGVDRAAAVVAAVDDSNVNIQIGLTASQIAPEARLVVRVGDELYESTARRIGADSVVIPEVVSGTELGEDLGE